MTQLLSNQHPRLFIDTSKIEYLKKIAGEDDFFKQLYNLLINEANALLDKAPVAFNIVGPRMLKNCQIIHHRVTSLSLAFLLSNDEKFAKRAMLELSSAASYPHWNPDHFLDTAELITAFAIAYDWLFHALSDDEKSLLKNSIIDKGINKGLKAHAENIWWANHKYNWNQVCNGGLIIGALAIADDEPILSGKVFDATVKFLPTAFNSYGNDGGWEAGPDYWEYTTWYSALLIDALLTATGNDFALSETNGFDKTGLFGIYNVGNSNKHFNFADANETCQPTPILYWLGKQYKHEACIKENKRRLLQSVKHGEPINAFNMIWYTPADSADCNLPFNKIFSDIHAGYFRSSWNKNATSLAFKGGSNQADHAHLDLGSFVYDRNGVRWAVDMGRDNYDLPGYFDLSEGGGRWKYFRLNTFSHNTLVLNNDVQRANAKAKIVEYSTDNNQAFASIDLTEAYLPHAKSVNRTFKMNDNVLIVSDKVEPGASLESVQWQMLTDAEVQLNGRKAVLLKGGEQATVRIISPTDACFELKSAEQELPQMQNTGYNLLLINFIGAHTEKIMVSFE